MKVVFFSLTGQTRKFVKKLGYDAIELKPNDPFIELDESFIFVAPTYEPEANDIAYDFMDTGNNAHNLKGVAGSGNLNFGDDLFCYVAKEISDEYDVPILHLFEFQGNDKDAQIVKDKVKEIENN